MNANYWIEQLHLLPHPEGGYYKETYRCQEEIEANGFEGKRNTSTAIYFLLEGKNKSHFHRILSDEIWFFHEGDTLEILVLRNDSVECLLLGKDIAQGEAWQVVIPAGVWFAARLKDQQGYALVSCTVAPGFDFRDFELGRKKELLAAYPQHALIIDALGYPD
jgi:predicted cupin superfamily sugar epimerase